jgi:hypothetical protein
MWRNAGANQPTEKLTHHGVDRRPTRTCLEPAFAQLAAIRETGGIDGAVISSRLNCEAT